MEDENKSAENETIEVSQEEEKPNTQGSSQNKKSGLIYASFAVFTIIILISSLSYYLGSKKITGGVSTEVTPTLQEQDDVVDSITSTPTLNPSSTLSPTPTTTSTPTPTVTPLPKADLKISEYKFSTDPENPTQGELFTITISIYNQGNKASGPFWWEWWPTKYSAACRYRIDNLVARGGRVVSCTYTYGGWSTYETKAVADSDNEVEESDETNNISIKTFIPNH